MPYPVKVTERDSYRGKQFGTAATKTGKQPSEYFDPKHKYLAEVGTALLVDVLCSHLVYDSLGSTKVLLHGEQDV